MSQKELIYRLSSKLGETFHLSDAAAALNSSNNETSKVLSRWEKQGWVKRIKSGFFAFIPLDTTPDQPLENIWSIIPDLFSPGYIGGWSAAEHWDFTEQLFIDICVLTEKRVDKNSQEILGISFCPFHIKSNLNFGTEVLWIKNKKCSISDPNKTIIDMLYKPKVGGGIQHTIDCFKAYIKSNNFDPLKLVLYAKQMNNGVIFKRLGYLCDILLGKDHDLTKMCLQEMTKGPSYMDPSSRTGKFLNKWALYIPETLQF